MLPIFQGNNREFNLMQTTWAGTLNPLLNNPITNGSVLESISIVSGDNTINHKLGRKLQGWIVIRMIGAFVQLYDKQSTNVMTDKTLILNSNGAGTISLVVF